MNPPAVVGNAPLRCAWPQGCNNRISVEQVHMARVHKIPVVCAGDHRTRPGLYHIPDRTPAMGAGQGVELSGGGVADALAEARDTKEKIEILHQSLAKGVSALATSEGYRSYLEFASHFRTYSASNTLLILLQKPNATRVAGHNVWKGLGRHVSGGKGCGIKILAPSGGFDLCACGHSHGGKAAEGGACKQGCGCVAFHKGSHVANGFRIVHVFDASDTDGAEIPEHPAHLLHGAAPAKMWEGLAGLVDKAGFGLERGDCGGANGTTNYTSRVVTVRDDVDDAQAAKTLAHELGHVLLHGPAEEPGEDRCRGEKEVEAESVAFLVSAALGLSTDDYSFGYVTTWSGSKPEAVLKTANRTKNAARAILETLEGKPELFEKLIKGEKSAACDVDA